MSAAVEINFHVSLNPTDADAFRFLPCSQGGKAGAVQKCVACRGRGMRIMVRQLAPGMVQQMQSVCTDCSGEGKRPAHVWTRPIWINVLLPVCFLYR